ncbi:hypothetical protein OS128_09555 [Corynebacterium sp. P5848]|uniref:hypothetical protein n=1 Tax=Corynebacterium marambiense TaxID=2765364 RepID=UPI002260E3C2|nr:hypothetical protein [Corynebacterium marambiense]MCX7543161.1 hypothetical protein [Corynebacterium marambiense]
MTDREMMSTPHAVDSELRRGAILPPDAEPPANARSVPLVAATYASPTHTIVRLVAEPLLEAEDTALAAQGFSRTRTTGAGQVRPTAIGFPAWPILVDPDNAREALHLVGDVEWARRVAHSRPGDVKKRFEALAADLTASAPHFVPPLFEEIARILHDVGNDALALQFFGRAREIERTHGIPVDPARHRAVFTEFSSLGIVGARELTAEAEGAVGRFADPRDAFDYLLELNTARIAVGGQPPYADLARDLRDVGAAAGLSPDRVDEALLERIVGLVAVRRAPAGFFDAVRDSLISYIGRHPEAASWLLEARPRELGVDDYLILLRDSGIWRTVTTDPLATGDLILRLVDELRGGAAGEVPATPHLIETIDAGHDALAGRRSGSRGLWNLSLDLLDALCAAGVVFPPRSFYDLVRADSLNEPWLCWLGGEHEEAGQSRRDLSHLAADPVLGPVAARSLDPGFLAHHADTVLGHPGATTLLNMRLDDFAAERAAAAGSFEALERFVDGPVQRLRNPRIDEFNPGAIERIFAFDRAEEVAAALRLGLAVEYTFPALEEAVERVRALAAGTDTRRTVPGSWESDPLEIHESWPLHAVSCGGFVVVFDADGIVRELRVPGEVGKVVGVRTVGGRVRVSYKARHAHEESVFWSGDDAGHDTGELVTSVEGSASWEIGTGRITANGLITDGDVTAGRWQSPVLVTPSAVVGVRSLVHHACPSFDPRTGERCGEIDLRYWPERLTELGVPVGDLDLGVLPPAVWEFSGDPDADWDTVHRLEYSTCLPITGTTADSLTGHCGGWHLNFPVDHGRYHHIIGPLGTFRIPRDRRLSPTTAIARPGGGVVVNCADGFIDAVTGHRLPQSCEGDGRQSYLDHLPDTCLHFLSARDEILSASLRTVTADDVAPLLDDDLNPGHRRELIAERLGVRDTVVIDAIDGLVCRSAELAQAMNEIHPPVDRHFRVPDISEDLDAYIHGYLGTGGGGLNNYGALLTNLGCVIQRNELHSYGYEEWDRINWGIGFIGNERVLAALVAAPCLSPELRREAAVFVRSLLKAGLVCNGWRYVEVPADAVESTETLYEGWHDDCAVISYRYDHNCTGSTGRGDRIVLLAPVDKRHWMGVDLGDSADTSLEAAALTVVLDAVDAQDSQNTTGRLDTLRASADTIARDSAVPAQVLLRLLGAPLPPTHRETKEQRALLGLTVQQSKTVRESIAQFEPEECAAILAAAVNPDNPTEITTGHPDTDGVSAAIGRVLGEPAVRLTDSDLDLLVGRQTDPDERTIRRLLRGEEVVDDTGVRDGYLGLLITIAVECSISADEAAWIACQMRSAADWVRERPDTLRREWDRQVPIPGLADNSWTLVDDQPVPVLARIVAAGGMDDLISWLESGGFPPDPRRWDPAVAVPHLVQEVADARGLGTDAARYWLELLALTAPDDKVIRELNGWTRKALDAAATELLQRGLVIEAKRKGANRTRFLPGGWMEASSPDRPMEVWKAPHHLLWEDHRVRGMIAGCPQVMPPAELYLDVWERIQGGDEPGYTELRATPYRRKRR